MRLLPKGRVAVGDSWRVDPQVVETLLTRFYPTTELNDLNKNRLYERCQGQTFATVWCGRADRALR
jgi:hypothetical protein